MPGRRILVTSGLPYANGPLHIGHLVEQIQTDIWARFQRLAGNRCVYLCADDTHGTSVMLRARAENKPETELITEMNEAHRRDSEAFGVLHEQYGSTHSPANRALCHEFWAALRRAGLVSERDVTQLYDPEARMFLADRFVLGRCPRCDAPGQYGDACDKCGSTYSATDLKDPVSAVSGKPPEIRTAPHLFVRIEGLHGFLADWTQGGGHLQPEVANYLKGHFLGEPLRDWDVSRPAPYFGFEIPDAPGHYWYVWFDAPIGYVSTTKEWCEARGESFDDWWRSPDTEIRHFIGKDIVYFHTLFWPAMLKVAGLSLPRRVQVHGMLTVDGEKMSKSKGTFVAASTYAAHLDPQYLRYFYASKLTGTTDDLDLEPEEFAAKVNSDIVGKVVNLASRTARFVRESGLSRTYPEDGGMFARAAAEGRAIAEAYEACDTSRAMRLALALADRANEYVERMEPWRLKKTPGSERALQDVCSVALNLFRQVVVYLAPVLPRLAEQTGALLGRPVERWEESGTPLASTPVAPFQPMAQRIDASQVRALFAASAQTA